MQKICTLFDSLLEPSFVIDKDLNIKYCNEAAAGFCGSSPRRIQKMNFKTLVQFPEEPKWLSDIGSISDATSYIELKIQLSTDPETKRVQITCQKLLEVDNCWLIYMRDVTLEDRLQAKYQAEAKQKEIYIGELEKAQARLEEYNKNLEKLVEERTLEIRKLSQLQKTLLDALHEGFFVFDAEGTCLNVSSRACQNTIETVPDGKKLEEVLKIIPEKITSFQTWYKTLFSEMLPFEDLVPLGPTTYRHSQGKNIKLDFHPIRNDESAIMGVVVVASDITDLIISQKRAHEEKEYAQLIINVMKNKKEVTRALAEIQKLIMSHHSSMAMPRDKWDVDQIARNLHTIKGGASTFHFDQIAQVTHHIEDQFIAATSEGNDASLESVKSSGVELFSEFQMFKKQMVDTFGDEIFSEVRKIEIPANEFKSICDQLVDNKLYELAKNLELAYIAEPIGQYFEPYKNLVAELAKKLGKEVEPVEFENAQLPIYAENYTHLFGCLVHAFRNAVDHGIEMPEVRQQKQKNPSGKMKVQFLHSENKQELKIRISDDGGGILPDRIRKKLDEKNIKHDHETDDQVIQHIFDSNFSTKQEVTEISGRGVGLDAVRDAALKLGGKCWVNSQVGKGSELCIDVPYFTSQFVQSKKLVA